MSGRAGKEKILIVEDEEDIRELLRYNLEKERYRVHEAGTGEEAIESVSKNYPDLVLLDLMLPGIDGLEVCRTLKRHPETSEIPIVMVTAKGEETDIVTGLELGADDYVTKPFKMKVLIARVRTVLRRQAVPPPQEETRVEIHGITINPGRHEVLVKDRPISLTQTEFRILHFLASRPGWVFTRYQIVDAVHGQEYAVTDRAVDVQIVGLRKKLGTAASCIETVRGVGYRFKE